MSGERTRAGKSSRMMQALAETLRQLDGRVALVAHSEQFARSYLLRMLPAEMRGRVDVITPSSAHRARGKNYEAWFCDHAAFEHGASAGEIVYLLAVERRHPGKVFG